MARGTTESNLQPQWRHWWGRGFESPYRANAQCRERTPTTQHGRQEPTLPAPACNQIRLDFFVHSTRVRFQMAGERYCRGYRMRPLPTGGTGLLLLFKGQGKGGSSLTLRTYPKLPRSNSIQKGIIDARCRESNPGSITKSWNVVRKGESNPRPISLRERSYH